MNNNWVRALLLLALVLGVALPGSAADWQWTKGQGWSEGAGTPRGTAADQLKHAYSLEKKGEFYDAARQYFLLVRVYPASDEAGIALQRLAKCLFDMENYYDSYQAIEQVLARYPNSGRLADLVGIQYRIGRRLQQGGRPSILEDADPMEEGHKAALEVFASVLKHDPYGPLADDALVAQGRSYLALRDAKNARGCFNRLVNDFGKSDLVNDARIGLVQCDVLEGKAHSHDVQRKMQQLRSRQPGEMSEEDQNALRESVNTLEELEAEKMFKGAQFYERRGSHESLKAALFQYNEIVRRYPRTSYAKQAMERAREIKVPEKDDSVLPRINLNPFRKKEKPAFVTPQRGAEAVQAEEVIPPIPGTPNVAGESKAHVVPMSPERTLPLDVSMQPAAPTNRTDEMSSAPALGVDEMGADDDLTGAGEMPVLEMTPRTNRHRSAPSMGASVSPRGRPAPTSLPEPEATEEANIAASTSGGGVNAVPTAMGDSVVVRTPTLPEPAAATPVAMPPKLKGNDTRSMSGAWAIEVGDDTRVVKPIADTKPSRPEAKATAATRTADTPATGSAWAERESPAVADDRPATPEMEPTPSSPPPGVVPDTPAVQDGPQLELDDLTPTQPTPAAGNTNVKEDRAVAPATPAPKQEGGWNFSDDLR